ncbi:uncharacterized protein BT62DRAFT_909894, partial [Guyanagaster necrorhizus]
STQAAADLFERRSGDYSDRPGLGWGDFLTFMRYSTWWRNHRQMFHEDFQLCAVPAYYPVQMEAMLTSLQQLHKYPDAFCHHIRRYVPAT